MSIKLKNTDEGKGLLKTAVKLAFPISLQQMLSATFHLVDTAFIVRLGVVATAAIGACSRWMFYVHLFIFGLSSGMSVLVSQYWGVKDIKNIRKSFTMGLICAVSICAFFSIVLFIFAKPLISIFIIDIDAINEGVKYLKIACWGFIPMSISFVYSYFMRSTEEVVIPLISTVVSVAANTALNYILIFGHLGFPALGIRGAAIATLSSFVLQMLLMISLSYIRKTILAARLRDLLVVSRDFAKKYFVIALPTLANEVIWATGVNVYSYVYGQTGSKNVAAFTIYSSVEQVIFTFFVGVCSACAVIVGKMVGRGEFKKAYNTAKKFMIYGTLFSLIMGAILIVIRNPVLSLLAIPDKETAELASRLLLIYAFAMPMFILPYISIVGIFRAGGDTRAGLLFDLINVWAIGVPIVFIAGIIIKLPFIWVFTLMWTEHIAKAIMCIFYFKSKKWIRRVTEPNVLEA